MPKITGEPKAQLTIRIAADTFRELDEREKLTHLSKSAIIQLALNEYFKNNKRNGQGGQ